MPDQTAPDTGVLFTAFEPSGDTHAAPVISELRRRRPRLSIYAWGGPRMRAAGAELIEETGSDAAMGAAGLAKIAQHWQLNRRIDRWLAEVPGRKVTLHVPVDSPAANFPICGIARRHGCRIVHLVAPQIWSWGPWRIGKLRRLTDHVLCLLPFEEKYFVDRGVPATFIGHPVVAAAAERSSGSASRSGRATAAAASGPAHHDDLPTESPKLALLPGSRPGEIRKHIKPMLAVHSLLRRGAHPGCTAMIAAATVELAAQIEAEMAELPADGVGIETDRLDEILEWADAALVCSGTATLNVASHLVPMVVMYRMNPVAWFAVGRWLVRSRFFALPNLVADREIVPEFVPHFTRVAPISAALDDLLSGDDDSAARKAQRANLAAVIAQFAGKDPAGLACDVIEEVLAG